MIQEKNVHNATHTHTHRAQQLWSSIPPSDGTWCDSSSFQLATIIAQGEGERVEAEFLDERELLMFPASKQASSASFPKLENTSHAQY